MQLAADPPDFRAEKMDSLEGKGLAAERREAWFENLDLDDLAWAYGHKDGYEELDEDPDPEETIRYEAVKAKWALERADLIGFWVAWHAAGGFRALERGGWNRATIFRKVRRFRAVFGQHPDEYQFDWIRLDPRRLWDEQLRLDVWIAQGNDPPGLEV